MPSKSVWARAFAEQARLDLDFAGALYALISDADERARLGSRPELYCPAIYAYCQQAIEKALKAWLWHSQGSIPMAHNPMTSVLRAKDMKKRNRPEHLNIIDRNQEWLGRILNMAPGASYGRDVKRDQLLSQPNTEYPFALPGGQVKLPHQEVSVSDVAAALKIAKPVVNEIRKHLEASGLAPE
ncbi:MAG: hypothetical protein Q7T82_15585 [Armatimonadota bacterium]|nr:hypothetical protein [Armatimonadota bacterium]